MERKQGFFSALKEEVVRGLSPGRSRAKSPARSASPMSNLLRRRKGRGHHVAQPEPLIIARSGSLRPVEALSPLKEGPDQDDGGDSRMEGREFMPYPFHETSSAQYILQQYTAASGGQRIQNSIHNAYAMGKVKMIASEFETANKVTRNRNSSKAAESGGFVLWQMNPDMWYVELALGGSKGLDPGTTASMFTNARCIGEKKINGDDCFILKICADPATLKARSEGPAEIIRHVLFGYFSQKTGLLVHIEDSHLTRIQNNGGDAVYWETTINSFLDDYRPVDGVMIAHSGRSVVTLFRFGDTAMSHTRTRMEEAWVIEEAAFNVPGLSMDCFIPPAELRFASISETCELPKSQRVKPAAAYRAKVAALDRSRDNTMWKTDI
ncbi:hypothetical protein GH714_004582 [Hevea brasiliensis]|uniref:Uncharacterized protein n=1 Tax=Hevea brasiliensis TaxID=3981 RepID=A0A6A6MB10_HEVBR|nr:hypothetical protein GH714_004582 [Hevea brasiliensis]